MKHIFILGLLLNFCLPSYAQKPEINNLMDRWHQSAADADLDAYLGFMADDCYYLGTDKTEIWTKEEFFGFCKPYFKKKETWDFKAVSRNIYLSDDKNFAWFEEVLDTGMGPCRGSGVLVAKDGVWKLKQYNLAMLVDNANIKPYLELIKKNKE